MTEAVIHDLESIEVEIQRRESTAPILLELIEPPTEPFDKDRSVDQPGERVAEPKAAEPLLRGRPLGDVG